MPKIFVSLSLFVFVSLGFAGENVNSIDETWRTADTVLGFQLYSTIQETAYKNVDGRDVKVKFLNLNSNINGWYMMDVTYGTFWGDRQVTINIENNYPNTQTLSLVTDGTLQITNSATGETKICNILGTWVEDGTAYLALKKDPYMFLCENAISVRNQKDGYKDTIAWGSDTLRDVFGDLGDGMVNLAKETVFQDDFYEGGEEVAGTAGEQVSGAPADAAVLVDSGSVAQHQISIQTVEDTSGGMTVGHWYQAKNYSGVYVSVMKPKFVAKEILETFTDRVNAIDSGGGGSQSTGRGEGGALVVSVALDLNQYTLGWANGTEHPGVGWSSRAKVKHLDGEGPDGFNTLAPLEFPGVINPVLLDKVIGTFAGGFQRRHSAFRGAPYTSYNRGHHYGFQENGVLMSTIVPNLATFIAYKDGSIEMKTWQPSDDANLPLMKDIRQNGVPLIDNGEPGLYVNNWGAGNWSGSAEALLKTPRTSACIYQEGDKKYLILSYFSTHTPSAMARVLQSYKCNYAIHLDMNSPRFAYAALFTKNETGAFDIEHLHESMNGEDVKANGVEAPRSALTPTYKDFFYVMKRN